MKNIQDADLDNSKVADQEVAKEVIDEGTAAEETLKPKSRKADMLTQLVGMASGMNKQDLSGFLTRSLAEIGHEADSIPSGAAAKNKNSVAAKSAPVINIKEDLDDLFGGDETLTEDFKEKVAVIMESVLNVKAEIMATELEEEFEEIYEARLEEAITEINEATVEKLNDYLDYVVEAWMEENKVAIESSIRTDITESFIQGLRDLFSESYIDIPEEKLDVVEALSEQIEELTSQLNDEINENIEIKRQLEEAAVDAAIDELSEGMIATTAEKFRQLAEGVEYTDIDEFVGKLEIIKESVFKSPSTTLKNSQNLITEDVESNLEERKVAKTAVSAYVSAISNQRK